MSARLIPASRLKGIPIALREAHEYCFFLHDRCAQILKEYEDSGANLVKTKFRSKKQFEAFSKIASEKDIVQALRDTGFDKQVRKILLNQIIMALTSDALLHIFEALKCMEKRKVVVAFNLLRKPLTDNFLYLLWIFCDEEGFFLAFTSGDPAKIKSSVVKQRAVELVMQSISKLEPMIDINGEELHSWIFDTKAADGLQLQFQHAVHLVTTERVELKTSPENFNFVFKDCFEDDIYEHLYEKLPQILYIFALTIFQLFNRIKRADKKSISSLYLRMGLGLGHLIQRGTLSEVNLIIEKMLAPHKCPKCEMPFKLNSKNYLGLVIGDNYKCQNCRTNFNLPFSYLV